MQLLYSKLYNPMLIPDGSKRWSLEERLEKPEGLAFRSGRLALFLYFSVKVTTMKILRNRLLVKSLMYDAIGMATMSIPFVGPFLDLLWAPYAAKKMAKMYPGNKGKLASVLVFLEEILPFTDIIPTFTLMWLYSYVWKKAPEETIIEAEVIN